MQYEYVWFDLGLTLVGNKRAEDYKNIMREFSVERSLEEIELAYYKTDKLFMREYKGILGGNRSYFLHWYLGVLNYYLHIELNIQEVYNALERNIGQKRTIYWKAFDYAIPTIKSLKKIGLKVGLISNWDKSCREVLKNNNLLELLDTVVVSSEIGFEKPSEEIFKLALKEGNAYPESSLYIGDNYYDDVIGASKVGMKCLLINPYGRIGIEELDYPHVIKDIRDILNYVDRNHQGKEVV